MPELSQRRLKEQVVSFYAQNNVMGSLEKLLNTMYLDKPADVHGYMVSCWPAGLWLSIAHKTVSFSFLITCSQTIFTDCHRIPPFPGWLCPMGLITKGRRH